MLLISWQTLYRSTEGLTHLQHSCVYTSATTHTYTNMHFSICRMHMTITGAQIHRNAKHFHSMRRVLHTENSYIFHNLHFISFLIFIANIHCRILVFDVYIIISTRGSDDHPSPHFTSSCGYHGNQLLESINSKNATKKKNHDHKWTSCDWHYPLLYLIYVPY